MHTPKENLLHPRDRIVAVISRIYSQGMTTTSGGNLSVKDEDGSIWITPRGIDKGALAPEDIVRVRPDGAAEGRHEPSSEYPFHHAIYCARNDIRAIVHAHPPALAAFAITRTVPDTAILPGAFEACGRIGYAPYVLPGSRKLGEAMAKKFGEGFSAVLMENHGIVTVGNDLLHAFTRFESMDFCARTELNAKILGGAHALTGAELERAQMRPQLDEWAADSPAMRADDLAADMVRFLRRCYARKLMTAAQGTCSVRVDASTMLITPESGDRDALEADDLVLIRDGKQEAGKEPDRNVRLHMDVYRKHPEVNAVLVAQPPHIMAFAVSDAVFDSRTIPESYIVLKTVASVPFALGFVDDAVNARSLADHISAKTPVVLCRNHSVVTAGGSLLECFDRLEVAEFSARAVIASKAIGAVVPMSAGQISELEKAWKME